jgi:glutathione synthase/RimK-type ligase-like ATP-grasp enzyme
MDFLIVTEPDDAHAIAVQFALESMEHRVRLLFTADQPTKQKNSVFISNKESHYKIVDSCQIYSNESYDVVWWRRPRKPFVSRDGVHADDYYFVCRENTLFHDAITQHLAPSAWWINPQRAATRANNKLLQLKIAAQCGMVIPITLFSNNPQDIREFAQAHKENGVIYKPLCSNFWFEESELKITYTSPLHSLPKDHLLQMTPGVYQKNIRKAYELRVTCFGDYIVAAKLNSQQQIEGQYDWRKIQGGVMQIDPYILPEKIKRQIQKFMKAMGLVFGALDFIVTKEQEYVFLEVNEQGQFLWIEESNPEIHLLDPFIQFIVHKKRAFVWDKKQKTHNLLNYNKNIHQRILAQTQEHVYLNSAKAYTTLQQQA